MKNMDAQAHREGACMPGSLHLQGTVDVLRKRTKVGYATRVSRKEKSVSERIPAKEVNPENDKERDEERLSRSWWHGTHVEG